MQTTHLFERITRQIVAAVEAGAGAYQMPWHRWGAGTAQPHNLIVLDRFAKATVIESYAGLGDGAYFTNAVTEAVVGDGATLTHLKLQRESAQAYHVGTVDVRQARDSHLMQFSFATGAALSRTNIYTELRGEGCGATLNGLYLGDGEQHIDHQTRIEHVEPNCYSREHYKGILDGSAHGVFNGKVYVHPEAQKTDGKQTNNTLLLSEKAQIDTKPQLEIFADDVKCTHGATVGRLDETSLFYMPSTACSSCERDCSAWCDRSPSCSFACSSSSAIAWLSSSWCSSSTACSWSWALATASCADLISASARARRRRSKVAPRMEETPI